MNSSKFPEELKTPWFSFGQSPSRAGCYELREVGTNKALDGRFAAGKWYISFGGTEYAPLVVAHSRLEWRGLIADPRTLKSEDLTPTYFGYQWLKTP